MQCVWYVCENMTGGIRYTAEAPRAPANHKPRRRARRAFSRRAARQAAGPPFAGRCRHRRQRRQWLRRSSWVATRAAQGDARARAQRRALAFVGDGRAAPAGAPTCCARAAQQSAPARDADIMREARPAPRQAEMTHLSGYQSRMMLGCSAERPPPNRYCPLAKRRAASAWLRDEAPPSARRA